MDTIKTALSFSVKHPNLPDKFKTGLDNNIERLRQIPGFLAMALALTIFR